jgi:hypothetical protein
VSTDITAVAVVDASGGVVACAPGAAGAGFAAAAEALWSAARRHAAVDAAGLEHVVVPTGDAVVAVVEAHDHRAVAVTGPRPAVGLLLFDLRTCLGDAFAGAEEAP